MEKGMHFEPIRDTLAELREPKPTVPKTVGEYEEEEKPMGLKEHFLSFRANVQHFDRPPDVAPDDTDHERIKRLNELVSPELVSRYGGIIELMRECAQVNEGHPLRERIDINEATLAEPIAAWIEQVKKEVTANAEAPSTDDLEALEASCWMFFDSLQNVMNARAVERDIAEHTQGSATDDTTPEEQKERRAQLLEQLARQYQMSDAEARVLVDLGKRSEDTQGEYGPRKLVDTLNGVWNEYGLNEHKKELGKISLGYLMARGSESFAPSLFQGLIEGDQFNVEVFLEYLGLSKLSDFVDMHTGVEVERLMLEVEKKINKRVTDSLFFHEFEFIHDKSLGEVYAALARGKDASRGLIQDSISQFAPTAVGILGSLGFLTKINPLLGGIGLSSLPIMFHLAKKHNKELAPAYQKEIAQSEEITTRVAAVKSTYEEARTSPDSSTIAAAMRSDMDQLDTLSTHRSIRELQMQFNRMIPYDIATAIATVVGGAMQQMGAISGGAILSNVIYTGQLTYPIQKLTALYFNQFARYVQDIDRMNEILGEYDKMDLPEGAREADRTPVSQLENLDIEVHDLQYKQVLKGMSLSIKQGEFVTIRGESGRGKSTLLRNMIGLYKPTGGEVRIGGTRVGDIKKYGDESLYSALSYCNQQPQIIPDMTLRENLTLWTQHDLPTEEIVAVLHDLRLDKFSTQLDVKAEHLSGGERVRLGLARALLKQPKILILDEPTAGLDSTTATEVRKLIEDVRSHHPDTTIVCVSHDEALLTAGDRSIQL